MWAYHLFNDTKVQTVDAFTEQPAVHPLYEHFGSDAV
jgi:hypothetical protein